MVNNILIIDCQIAGVAGDMFLGALLDLGADEERVHSAIKSLENREFGYGKINIEINQVMRGNFKARKIDITSEKNPQKHGDELIDIVEKAITKLELSGKAKKFASNTIHTIVSAEAELHNADFSHTHLHEVSLVDTAAEIIGVAVALDDLDLFDSKIYSTPVSVGGGLFKFSHGTVSSPAPATLAILTSKKFPFQGGPVESELATPTGVSIIVNLVDEINRFYPQILPLKVGYGAGSKDFKDAPSVLRMTIGNTLGNQDFFKDEIAILETNLDDTTGEIIGYTVDRLLQEGAKDVNIIPMFTKKNRPGQILKVIIDAKDVEHLSKVLIQETGTLGIRVNYCERHVISREVLTIEIIVGDVKEHINIKVSKDKNGEIIKIKPEFEDVKRIAIKNKKPLREIMDLATVQASNDLRKLKVIS
jgi:pyridinium-3,5-bisthiocarboxylic acid mononucleotide nickel chelatase